MHGVFTRQFDRPHDHTEEAMRAELAGLPGKWRVYGIVSGATIRRYYVEFRATDGERTALLEALEKVPAAT